MANIIDIEGIGKVCAKKLQAAGIATTGSLQGRRHTQRCPESRH
jgi:hypothetical protein